MSEKQTLLDEVEMAAMWFVRKMDAVSVEIRGMYGTIQRGEVASVNELVRDTEALVEADQRLKQAKANASGPCYRNEVDSAVRRGLSQ